MKAKEIIKIMEKLAPSELAESWDNVGLQIGDLEQEIKKILVTLDLTDKVVDEAIEGDIDLIISHHPFIFKPLSNITLGNPKGRIIKKLLINDISLYVSHTNMDIADGGLNDMLANKLKLNNIDILTPSQREKLYKIAVYVPEGHEDDVRAALGDAEAGWIGNYSHCTFQTKGIGTFKPREGADPFIGKVDEIEKVDEYRIETIATEDNLPNAINKMIEAHPYEEVAYDIYPLELEGEVAGLGRIGKLKKSMDYEEFIYILKDVLSIDTLRKSGVKKEKIKTVGLCTGSGVDFMKYAVKSGADVYITGDVKYHEAQMAEELDILLLDAGHFATEIIFMEGVKEYLDKEVNEEVEVLESRVNKDSFKIV